MIADDLAELADLRLDGEIADEPWAQLLARHGQPLANAVDAARRTRAALAGLPSPHLPDSVLQGILAATRRHRAAPQAPVSDPASPAPLRFPARWWVTTALAAGVVVAVLATRGEPAPPALPTAGIARHDTAKENGESDRMAGAEPAPSAPSVTASAPLAKPGSQVPAPAAAPPARIGATADEWRLADAESGPNDLAVAAQTTAPESPEAAAMPMPSAGATVMAAPSEPPFELAEAAPAPSSDDQAFARLEREARTRNALPAAPAPAEKQAPVRAPGPVALSLAFAPAPAVDQRGLAKDEQAFKGVLPQRALLVTLANRTVSDLQVQAGSVWLLGYAANGALIWQTALRADEAQVVPAGRELAWTESLAGLEVPARVVELRLRGGTTLSETLPLR
ncbi:MAG: hypothetical protein H0W72_03925 [Planctomycetes bacterium]|nr:hypothetical protein [Planctomycetota bacterium]